MSSEFTELGTNIEYELASLWQPVLNTDSATGVEISPAHLYFRAMLVRQLEAGIRLCLCRKNNEADVDTLFRTGPEMLLRTEHIVASRVNWKSKASNLRSLRRT